MSRYDTSGAPYIKMMDEKTTQFNNLVRKAQRLNRDNGGKVSKEEAAFYYQAVKVCEEIMNMNVSQRAVYNQWNLRKQDCEDSIRRISYTLAPPPPPAAEPVKAAEPAKPAIQAATQKNSGATVKSATGEVTTESGFTTKNACKDVPADVIEKWYKAMPGHGFDAVVGMQELKDRLMNEAASFGWDVLDETLKISPVQSYFFYGPPGTGKTFIIEAFARELMEKGFKYIHLVGGDIHASLVGVAEKTVQIAFQEAIDNEPCLIFIDEVDNVCVSRDGKAEGHEKRLTVAFLEAYNQLKSSGKRVIFMGATNHPGAVDEAMLDRISLVKIPLPTEEARCGHMKRAFGKLQTEDGFSFEDMAAATDNCSYRDLNRLKDAMLSKIKTQAIETCTVTKEDGQVDQAATDAKASQAILDGTIRLTRAMFEETQQEIPPSDKTKIREELKAFEENVAKLQG